MKSIACINIEFPTVNNTLDFDSEGSLRDYDIVVFDPELNYYDRVYFSGGGSCLSVEDTARFAKASTHWSRELSGAIAAGKTVFVILNSYHEDQAATGSSTPSKGSRTYHTTAINNYSVIPGKIRATNARGRSIKVKDSAFKGIYDAIKDIAEYRVVLEAPASMRIVFAAKDGTNVGGVVSFPDSPGSLVLLPYFDFEAKDFTEKAGRVWSDRAIKTSHAIVGQLVAVDRLVRNSAESTPPPEWLDDFDKPKAINEIEKAIAKIDEQIETLRQKRDEQLLQQVDISKYCNLLYENGKSLEDTIEKVLRLLGYTVEALRIGDLEIDHVIVGPSGARMIGETEGKDTSAIDISKFRQLESNIGEDFEREEISQHAKGVLFGNGFRLSEPSSRAEQFTQKSLTNASRLGSALIRTSDLYTVALYLLDHPEDDAFRTACRAAIETTAGGIVNFPDPMPTNLPSTGRS